MLLGRIFIVHFSKNMLRVFAPTSTFLERDFGPSTFCTLHAGTLAPWHPGTLAPWHPGTLAPWHPGTLARWHPGTLAPWHPGAVYVSTRVGCQAASVQGASVQGARLPACRVPVDNHSNSMLFAGCGSF